TYHVCDNGTTNASPDPKCDTGTVNVNVTEVNDAPTAVTDSKSTAEDTALTFPASDRKSTRLNSSHVASSYAVFCLNKNPTTSTHGPFPLTARTPPTTPLSPYTTLFRSTYHVCDNGTTNASPDPKCDTGTVNVNVTEVNDAPTAVTDSKSTAEDTALTFPA